MNKESAIGLPITGAVLNNSVVLMRVLLAHGADPNTAVRGERMLHFAVANRCLDCVKVLVAAGADVNATWVRGDPLVCRPSSRPTTLQGATTTPRLQPTMLAHGVIIQKPEPISAKLANGDPTKGAAFFVSNCATCHATKAQSGSTRWPNLWKVVGRDEASANFNRYSQTLLAWEGTWTFEDLTFFSPVQPSQPKA